MSTKRFTRQQESFLVYLLDGEVSDIPRRMVATAESLAKLGLVEAVANRWRLAERGRATAETFKTWMENPELRPKPGGVLKKGRI